MTDKHCMIDTEIFCRELDDLLTKHGIVIDICICGEVLKIREWGGAITCSLAQDESGEHDGGLILEIDES